MKLLGALFVVVTANLLALRADAQDVTQVCQGGRVVTPATAGRCCWPGQVWSNDRARCEGPPACPAGLVPNGDDCQAQVVPTVPPPPQNTQPTIVYTQQQPGYAQPGYYQPAPATQEVDTGRTRPRLGLVISGAAMFAASYLSVAIVGAFAMDLGNPEGGWLLLPVGGPFICIAECFDEGEGLSAILVLDGLVQLAGLTLFIIGFAAQAPVYERAANDGPQLAVAPWVDEDGAGLMLHGWSF